MNLFLIINFYSKCSVFYLSIFKNIQSDKKQVALTGSRDFVCFSLNSHYKDNQVTPPTNELIQMLIQVSSYKCSYK